MIKTKKISLALAFAATFLAVSTGAILPQAAVAETTDGSLASQYEGQMLRDSKGTRVASVYRAGRDGSAMLIIDGGMVAVPADTLSEKDGQLYTSMTRREVRRLR